MVLTRRPNVTDEEKEDGGGRATAGRGGETGGDRRLVAVIGQSGHFSSTTPSIRREGEPKLRESKLSSSRLRCSCRIASVDRPMYTEYRLLEEEATKGDRTAQVR